MIAISELRALLAMDSKLAPMDSTMVRVGLVRELVEEVLAHRAAGWRPATDADVGKELIRYEPTTHRKLANPTRIVISRGDYPRKASHVRPVPMPPEFDEVGET